MAAGIGAAIAAHAPLAAKQGDDVTDTATYSAMAMQLTAASVAEPML